MQHYMMSQDSAVSIATGCGPDGRSAAVRVVVQARFTSLHIISTGPGPAQPLVQCVKRALSSGVKQPGREADH
jgi:hypothetical protein